MILFFKDFLSWFTRSDTNTQFCINKMWRFWFRNSSFQSWPPIWRYWL